MLLILDLSSALVLPTSSKAIDTRRPDFHTTDTRTPRFPYNFHPSQAFQPVKRPLRIKTSLTYLQIPGYLAVLQSYHRCRHACGSAYAYNSIFASRALHGQILRKIFPKSDFATNYVGTYQVQLYLALGTSTKYLPLPTRNHITCGVVVVLVVVCILLGAVFGKRRQSCRYPGYRVHPLGTRYNCTGRFLGTNVSGRSAGARIVHG